MSTTQPITTDRVVAHDQSSDVSIVPGCTKSQVSRYVSEFVGSAILVAVYKLSAGSKDGASAEMVPLCMAAALMMIVYHYKYISMAMFNPSVTIGHMIRNSHGFRRANVLQCTLYFVAQFVGALAGGFFAAIIGGQNVCMVHTFVDTEHYAPYQALLAEFLFATMWVSLHIHMTADKRTDGDQYYGMAIGACMFVSMVCIAPISGSAINPSLWVGTVASAAYCDPQAVHVDASWIYWVAHLVAGVLGGFWFNVYDCDEAYSEQELHWRMEKKRQRISTHDDDSEERGTDNIDTDMNTERVVPYLMKVQHDE